MKELFADFNNVDEQGRLRLNTIGTMISIEENGLVLNEGMEVILNDEEGLHEIGIVEFSKEENIWVASVLASE